LAWVLEPLSQRDPPVFGELEHSSRAPAGRLGRAGDELLLLQSAQLRIDLSVARGPEVPGRLVDELLDVVSGVTADRKHPEDHAAGGSQVGHVAARYIRPIDMSS